MNTPPSHRARAPKVGSISRVATVAVAGAKLGWVQWRPRGQSSDNAQSREAEIGRLLFQALAQLRGTALKVSQILSLQAQWLPPRVRDALAQACYQVTPLNRALIGKVFRQAFGCEPEALFAHFEHQAFAAASLGQVHRARLHDGRAVVVKIQYPGIGETIHTDLVLLRQLFKGPLRHWLSLPSDEVVQQTLDAISDQLEAEVNYCAEAHQLRWFADHVAQDGIVFPEVIDSLTRATVLTTTYLEGQHLAEWQQTEPVQALRNVQGQRLLDWLLTCALQSGQIQPDLHPGNVLFMSDGRLGLLDFGCTASLSPVFRRHQPASWRAWLAHARNDPQAQAVLWDIYRSWGVLRADVDQACFAAQVLPALAPALDWATAVFREPMVCGGDFPPLPAPDLATQANLARVLNQMPLDLLSFDRAWMGVMHILKELSAHVQAQHWLR